MSQEAEKCKISDSHGEVKFELSVNFFVNFCRYIGYFKKLT